MKKIGKRITLEEHKDAITIVIDQTIPRGQQLALEMWIGAWVGLGGLISYGAYTYDGNDRTAFLVCLAFWGFFLVRILKVAFWRRIGKEIIRITPTHLMIKNAFKTRGKDKFYDLPKVGKFDAPEQNIKSFMQQLDNSFWIIGGDTVHFTYDGREHVLGKQLPGPDAKQLSNFLNKSVERFSKKA